ncbi:TIGR03619 family F420-dependent LLM class oxidoreductase [Streptomyces fuscichromogenes]|uniref:LLM class F420-dependent oxidoreductase n=1 Tax=Streptomyces fuscichromogenes TaxID=1324013 RepID=A0A917XN90_9ACTN|nr:TIGR03619 family F420-dependent LLM class oxidoreductase [Streptomyces fuscichromogenes]GGN39250.1 LLM class F420-dependent oxidoreductase [Streptomyces fuscichromogenes]
MRFTVDHPIGRPGCAPELYGPEGLRTFARAAEDAGFDAIAFTEHPAPSAKWLARGGHATLDPLDALAFCAAVTERLRLMTYLMVLPYHSPLAAAKRIATVDRLSGGRLTICAGGGYLRSEFNALHVDFERRGELFDEALDVLRDLWAGESYTGEGLRHTARGTVSTPGPVQLPHPPVWIGGNGRNARRRAARAAQGWSPLLNSADLAATTRTATLSTPADLAVAVDELRHFATQAGRDPAAIEVQVKSRHSDLGTGEAAYRSHREHLGELADAGATWFVVRVPGGSVDEAVGALKLYGREVIEAYRSERSGS